MRSSAIPEKPFIVKVAKRLPQKGQVRRGLAFVPQTFIPHLQAGTLEPRMVQLMLDIRWGPKEGSSFPLLEFAAYMPPWLRINKKETALRWEVFEGYPRDGFIREPSAYWAGLEMPLGHRFCIEFDQARRPRPAFHAFNYTRGGNLQIWPAAAIDIVPENSLVFRKNPALVELMGRLK